MKSPDLGTTGLLPLQQEKPKLSLEPSTKPTVPGDPGTLAVCAHRPCVRWGRSVLMFVSTNWMAYKSRSWPVRILLEAPREGKIRASLLTSGGGGQGVVSFCL